MKKDIMSVLPDGSEFVSWEMPCSYDTVIHVNPAHKTIMMEAVRHH